MEPLYSYPKFEVLIILHIKQHVWCSKWFLFFITQHKHAHEFQNKYICGRKLKYSLNGCAFALLAALHSLFMWLFSIALSVYATITKTVNVVEWFESL